MAGRITPALSTDIIISALAFLISVALSAYLFGAFLAPQPLTGALFDSRWYDQLGRALWSGDELPADHPPVPGYSYPFVATGLASVSPRLLILLQTGAISAGVFCLLRTERNLTGRILVAPLALLSVSLLLSPAFMMAEAFGFGLAAAALWAFTSANKAAWGVLLLIAASLTKPAFQPVALLSVVMVLRLDRPSFMVSIIGAALILPQLMSSQVLTGRAHFTEAGRSNSNGGFIRRWWGGSRPVNLCPTRMTWLWRPWQKDQKLPTRSDIYATTGRPPPPHGRPSCGSTTCLPHRVLQTKTTHSPRSTRAMA